MRVCLDHTFDEATLNALLRALAAHNVALLRKDRTIPPLYDAGVVYQLEQGGEAWLDARAVLRAGAGDCEDLACWRAAELVVHGAAALTPADAAWSSLGRTRPASIVAEPFLRRAPGTNDYHCIVRYEVAGRTFEDDPSVRLGMYGGQIDPRVSDGWARRRIRPRATPRPATPYGVSAMPARIGAETEPTWLEALLDVNVDRPIPGPWREAVELPGSNLRVSAREGYRAMVIDVAPRAFLVLEAPADAPNVGAANVVAQVATGVSSAAVDVVTGLGDWIASFFPKWQERKGEMAVNQAKRNAEIAVAQERAKLKLLKARQKIAELQSGKPASTAVVTLPSALDPVATVANGIQKIVPLVATLDNANSATVGCATAPTVGCGCSSAPKIGCVGCGGTCGRRA